MDRFKFRVWNKTTKSFTTGGAIKFGGLCFVNEEDFGIKLAEDQDNYIIEQCTGLKDKNGNLIYEGDIVRERDILKDFTIKWSGRGFTNPTNGLYSLFDAPSEWEIIGNIHEQNLEELRPADSDLVYRVKLPRKTTGKIEKLDLSTPNNKMLTDLERIEIKINELVDAVNKHADIIRQIGQWGSSKGEFLWCETLTKFEPDELKGE